MNADGLEAVFLDNRERLLAFVRSLGAGDAAEDVLSELWLKLSTAPPGPVAAPLPYLYRSANNLMLDRYRSARQREQRERDWSDATGATADRSDVPAADRALAAREQLARMSEVLDGLPPRVSAIFRRHRLDGVGQRAIAAEFGVSLSTVESDLRIAYRAVLLARRAFDEA